MAKKRKTKMIGLAIGHYPLAHDAVAIIEASELERSTSIYVDICMCIYISGLYPVKYLSVRRPLYNVESLIRPNPLFTASQLLSFFFLFFFSHFCPNRNAATLPARSIRRNKKKFCVHVSQMCETFFSTYSRIALS